MFLVKLALFLICGYILNKYIILDMQCKIGKVLGLRPRRGVLGLIKFDLDKIYHSDYIEDFLLNLWFMITDLALSPIITIFLVIQSLNLSHIIKTTNSATIRKYIYEVFPSEDLDNTFGD